MIEKMPNRLNPLYKDGFWRQGKHIPNTLNEDGLADYQPFTVKRENGTWFIARGDEVGTLDWIPVREEMAKVIVVGIEAERRMKERKEQWESDSSFPDDWDDEGNETYVFDAIEYEKKTGSLALPKNYIEFYCHAVLQYLLKLPRGGFDTDKVYRSIEGFSFSSVDSYEGLTDLFKDMDFPTIGRIAKRGAQTESDLNMFTDAHSFIILGKDAKGDHLCFEKADSFENPVRLNTLKHIYENHESYRFAFQPFDNVMEQVRERGLQVNTEVENKD